MLLAIVTVIGTKDHFHISLEDEVVRGSIVVQNGQLLWPPPPPPTPAPGAATAAAPKQTAEKPVAVEPNYFTNTLKDALLYTGGNVSHLTQGYNFSCTLCPDSLCLSWCVFFGKFIILIDDHNYAFAYVNTSHRTCPTCTQVSACAEDEFLQNAA